MKNLKKCKRRLGEIGRIDYKVYKEKEEVKAALEEFVELESLGWKGKNSEKGEGTAIKLSIDKIRFYQNLFERLSDDEKCTIYSLNLERENISIIIILKIDKTVFGIKMTYDEKFSKCSPTSVLLDYIIEEIASYNEIDYFPSGLLLFNRQFKIREGKYEEHSESINRLVDTNYY